MTARSAALHDVNTAALRAHMNEADKRDREAAALYDAADILCNQEIDDALAEGDALGTAVFEYDIDIWPELTAALEALERAKLGDKEALASVLDSLNAMRGKLRATLYNGKIRSCEERLALEEAGL